ncbi:hypothetical protein KL953_06805 [Mycolicibacterium goodii]|uniref:hypothetical protein n=1 Tax=Mycolicibacterium goodii TaxID=134601 RepID=UPI001BDCF3CA|nr:hypothetical protein [Mycolicibacterium goodii]MBU8808601.1 hypothetical protein [Mycolicibacterium goodii]
MPQARARRVGPSASNRPTPTAARRAHIWSTPPPQTGADNRLGRPDVALAAQPVARKYDAPFDTGESETPSLPTFPAVVLT